jgi:hypothetical protein
MNKHALLFTGLYIAVLLGMESCASTVTSGNKSADKQDFNPAWAELRVSDGVSVRSINGKRTNWMPGFIAFVPAGRITLEAGQSGFGNTVTMTSEFLPGKCYMIEYHSENITTETRATARITTFRGNIGIREYGASNFPVPGKNESILEFALVGTYTRLFVDGYYYKLSALKEDAAAKLLLVVPAGKHRISSLASVGNIDLDVPPNRFFSFTVNTREAKIDLTKNTPLNYLGRWRDDIDFDKHIIFTLSIDGKGFLEMYHNNVLQKGGGMFHYRATDTNITVTSEVPQITMRYTITTDSNRLTLFNFWGNPMEFYGTKF